MAENKTEQVSQNEAISINGKVLQYGVLSDDKGYQIYLYPGMTLGEIAFDTMVTVRLLMQEGHIKDLKEFIQMVKHYYDDPQYRPLEESDGKYKS